MNLNASPSRLIWPALKCPPITSVGVSAKRENSSRRVAADCLGVGIRGRRPVEMGHLAGVVGNVPREQAFLALGLDVDAHMAGAVAGRRDQGDFVRKPGVAGDEIGLAGIGDRLHGIAEHRLMRRALAVVAPMLELGPAEHVAGVGECRHPFAADQYGVPADMVDMQMRAQHGVDAVGREACRRQRLEKRILAVVPGRHVAALLVVAEPGIDDDPARRRFHQQRVDRHLEPAFLVREMRNQPGQFLDFLVGRERQDEAGAADRLQLDHLCDFDLAHGPVHPAFPSIVVLDRFSILPRAIDDDGAELVAFLHREMRLRGIRQRETAPRCYGCACPPPATL